MPIIPYDKFVKKLESETVFFINTQENAVIKWKFQDLYIVKFQGQEPFATESSNKIISEGILEHNIITEEEFENF